MIHDSYLLALPEPASTESLSIWLDVLGDLNHSQRISVAYTAVKMVSEWCSTIFDPDSTKSFTEAMSVYNEIYRIWQNSMQ